ncbi:MAG: peptidase, partial [Clostridia bacterium]|nr:peptidase [Clostridia bacterium]
AVTYDNGTINYYRNGRLLYTKSNLSIKPGDIKNELNYIGKSHYDADAYLSAVVDDFRVYDKALTADEIGAVFSEGEISGEMLLKSYSIEGGQLVTGDKIDLPQTEGLYWNETDNLGLIDTETGAVKHYDQTEQVTLMASYGDYEQEYTVYVTGANESPYTINIDAADRSKDISDNMWGLFFEDINSAADGGLYAELVQNRSFETEKDGHLYSWETSGDVKINTENPLNENNPTYVTLGAGASVTNDGFMGMNIKNGENYNFSVYIRGEGSISVHTNHSIAANVTGMGADSWLNSKCIIRGVADNDNDNLTIVNVGETPVDLDMISLIPEDTYKGHGLRKDFMEALEAMHPKFLRFPGGCAIEGNTMETAWNWKDTVGDVAERKEMVNIWSPSDNTYMMTYGLGFYEYFQMCEDLGMEPVPILNCGMACQARSGGKTDEAYLVPMDELQPYIDDALDLIEFANGTDESNKWVKLRVDMGHPEPFNLRYIGIGNEQFGDIYFERYYEFAKQIHEKYPEMNLVTTSGLSSSGSGNDLAWNWINEHTELADRVDEHYYENPDWFRAHAYRYDNYRRDTNSKVFLGEYASKGNAWYNALSEAAFMTGLERNADVVRMASYAPMFAKYGNTQWSAANMIWFNNEEMMLTPNYYVQSLFSNNKGDYSLPTNVKMNGIDTDDTFHGGIVLGSWGTQ